MPVIEPGGAQRFDRDGFVAVEGLLRPDEIEWYRAAYERLLSGSIDVGRRRSDLGAGAEPARAAVENITQILWPSDSLPQLLSSPAYERALAGARELLGDVLVTGNLRHFPARSRRGSRCRPRASSSSG